VVLNILCVIYRDVNRYAWTEKLRYASDKGNDVSASLA